jgi:nucleoside-diphosphate-sugar epimerase
LKRKILITGSKGALGKSIFNQNNSLPYDCIFLIKKKNSPHKYGTDRHVIADLSKKEDLDDHLWGVDEVFHMAGSTHERNPKKYYINNFEATKRLIDKSETNGVKRFIYISTQAIGEKGGAYSHSKELAEDYLMQSKLTWTIIRPADIYGTDSEDSISSLCKLIKYSKILPIIGDGEYKINPVHLDDVADFILRLLECESKKSHFKVYNLAGKQPLSFKNFCKHRFDEYNKKPIFIHLPVILCKRILSLSNILRFTKLVPDQIDRLIIPKDNNIELASNDYLFQPREFSLKKI